MSLDPKAVEVLTRALPKEKIRTRQGKAGMEFAFITPDFVIETLNEAFGGAWGTKVVFQEVYDNVVVVGLQLAVPTSGGGWITKEQFGSCEVNRGMDMGSAFKGAASDALKKCATLLGLGLELYKDDEEPAQPTFRPPTPPSQRPASAPAKPPSPPRPQGSGPVAPPARPSTPPAPAAKPQPAGPNPFAGSKPAAAKPAFTQPQASAPASVPKPAVPAPARSNPFSGKAPAGSPNATQLSAMVNLANRKGITPSGLISLAGVMDEMGNPVQTFEDLTHAQAIQVIKAAQS